LADIAVEEIQEMVQRNVLEAIGEREGSQASSGSWHTAERAWWMFASWLEVVGYGHCIDLVEEQREVVQTMADFAVHWALILSCLYAARLVVQ
jgi:hypothetical protein